MSNQRIRYESHQRLGRTRLGKETYSSSSTVSVVTTGEAQINFTYHGAGDIAASAYELFTRDGPAFLGTTKKQYREWMTPLSVELRR
jgi:hypothetical protein